MARKPHWSVAAGGTKPKQAQRFRLTPAYPTEHQEGCELSSWLAAQACSGVVYCHVTNEGRRSKARGAQLKLAGLVPGFPDYLVFAPGGRCMAVELKRRVGGVVSATQKEVLERLRAAGVHAVVAHGSTEAIRLVSEWLDRVG